MRWFLHILFLSVLWTAPAAAQGIRPAGPDVVPTGLSPTRASLYRLLFELQSGLPYVEFIRRAPRVAFARKPEDIVEACRLLELTARRREMTWEDLSTLRDPLLVQTHEGHWLLYRFKEGTLYRIPPGQEEPIPVAEADFTASWTGEVITVAKPTPEELANAPRIVLPTAEHDFGRVWQGEILDHVFSFRNEGKSPLVITDVRASCGCTAALVSRDATGTVDPLRPTGTAPSAFAPGETGYVKVTLNTTGKRYQAASDVTVYSNDPVNPASVLNVKADVRIAVEVAPGRAYFGRVSKGSSLTRELRVTAMDDPSFEILEVTCPNPHVRTELKRLDADSATGDTVAYLLNITLHLEGMRYGEQINDAVRLKTTSKQSPQIEVKVDAVLSGDVFVAPSVLHFAPLYANREIVRFLILRNNGSRDVKVVDIRTDVPGLTFETQTLTEGKQYRLKATLKTGESPEPLAGEVVVVTDHPEQSELRLLVTSAPPVGSAATGGN